MKLSDMFYGALGIDSEAAREKTQPVRLLTPMGDGPLQPDDYLEHTAELPADWYRRVNDSRG